MYVQYLYIWLSKSESKCTSTQVGHSYFFYRDTTFGTCWLESIPLSQRLPHLYMWEMYQWEQVEVALSLQLGQAVLSVPERILFCLYVYIMRWYIHERSLYHIKAVVGQKPGWSKTSWNPRHHAKCCSPYIMMCQSLLFPFVLTSPLHMFSPFFFPF